MHMRTTCPCYTGRANFEFHCPKEEKILLFHISPQCCCFFFYIWKSWANLFCSINFDAFLYSWYAVSFMFRFLFHSLALGISTLCFSFSFLVSSRVGGAMATISQKGSSRHEQYSNRQETEKGCYIRIYVLQLAWEIENPAKGQRNGKER